MKKMYPFSAVKHAHDIEFRRARCFNEAMDLEAAGLDASEHWQLLKKLDKLRAYFCGQPVVWLDGKNYGLAVECVGWAAGQRKRF